MTASVRSLSTALALMIVTAGYFAYQARMERPAPPRPAPALSAARPIALPPASPTAQEILDESLALNLRNEQLVRLRALDRLWTSEVGGLETMIHQAEREFAGFVAEAQGKRGASFQEIQRRSAELSQLSAELRERRQQHSEAALRVLADWQRERLARETAAHREESQ